MDEPKALEIAEWFEAGMGGCELEAAAELRRLHQLALDQQGEIYALKMARSMEQKTAALKQAALLKALHDIGEFSLEQPTKAVARAAIAAAEGEKA